MIAGNIRNLDQDGARLSPALRKALNFVVENDVNALAPGRYDIDGDAAYVLVQHYRSRDPATCRAEAHVRYLDIQYVHSGREHMGYIPYFPSLVVTEDAVAERDVRFFVTPEGETLVVLDEGDYAVLYPTDVHRPGCAIDEPEDVVKLVFKIRLDAAL